MKDISIIIVSYKGGERLVRCLKSLQQIVDNRFSFEVIVVDNHSNDGMQPELISQFPLFSFLANTGNNGFANGCNLGASNSTGSNLLFLNPDTMVTADALFDMLEEIRVRPMYSIVSCRQIKDNGTKDRPYGKFLTILTLTGWFRAIRQIFTGSIEDSFVQTQHYLYPDWVSGSVVMIRRASFLRLGRWDEDFWMYFEDVDLCRRAKKRGGEIVKLKEASVSHTHGGSSRINREITVMTKTEVHISRHLYISKHEGNWNSFFMHSILILNNMILGLIPALLGMVFSFIPKASILPLTYLKLAAYYLHVLRTGNWMSVRSVNYGLNGNLTKSNVVLTPIKQ